MNFTDREKELLLSNAAVYSRIKVYDENGAVLQVFNEDDYIIDWDYEDYRYVPDQGFIGQFVERLLDGHFMNIPEDLSLENKEIEMEIAVKDPDTDTLTYHSFGRFIITKIEQEDTTGSYKFESSDYTKKFNVPFTPITYPCLAINLLNGVCNQTGVKLDSNKSCLCYVVPQEGLPAGYYCFVGDDTIYEFTTTKDLNFKDSLMLIPSDNIIIQKSINQDYTINREQLPYYEVEASTNTELTYMDTTYIDFVNNDFVIEDNQFEEDQTCRDVVCAIAKLGYTWARIGVDNKLHLDFVKKGESDVDTYNEIDTDKYYETKVTGDTVKPINKVLIGMSQVDGENIYSEQTTDKISLDFLNGNTSQSTTTGKSLLAQGDITYGNLIGLRPGSKTTKGGLTYIRNFDQSVSVSGTYSSDPASIMYGGGKTKNGNWSFANGYILPQGSYKIVWQFSNPSNVGILIWKYTEAGGYIGSETVKPYNNTTGTSGSYNLTVDGATATYVGLNANASITPVTAKIMVIASTETDTTYEPYTYGKSPNPNYQQAVDTVTGRNLIKIEGKNLYNSSYRNDDDGIAFVRCTGSEEDGIYTLTATGSDMYFWYAQSSSGNYTKDCGPLFEFNENIYTLTVTNPLFTNNYVTYYNKDKVSLGFINKVANSFTINKNDMSNAKYFSIRIGYGRATIGETYSTSVQLEKGSTSTDYKAYQSQSYEIDLGKNLFNKDDYIELTGTPDADTNVFVGGESPNRNIVIKCKQNTTYTIQKRNDGDTNRFAVCTSVEQPTSSTTVKTTSCFRDNNNNALTITSGPNDQYLIVHYYRTLETTITKQQMLDSIQIEEGDIATEYAPYYRVSKNLFDGQTSSGRWNITVGNVIAPNDRNGFRNINPIKIKPNTVYTASAYFTSGAYIVETDVDNKILAIDGNNGYIPIDVIVGTKKTKTITTHSDARYLYWYTTIATDNPPDFMLEEGRVYTNYEPYDKHIELCKIGTYQDYITKNTGKNLFDISKWYNYNNNHSWTGNGTYYISASGEIIGNTATANDYYSFMLHMSTSPTDAQKEQVKQLAIPVKPNAHYTVSFNNSNKCKMQVLRFNYDADCKYISHEGTAMSTDIKRTINITTLENQSYLFFRFDNESYSETPVRLIISNLQVEEGDTATDYEPYGNGEWYEYHNIKKYIIDGREDIAYVGNNSDANYSQFNIKSVSGWSDANLSDGGSLFYSNQSIYYANAHQPNKTQSGLRVFSNGNPLVVVSVPTPILTSGSELASYKEWLSNNNMVLYTVIQSPEVARITYQPLIDQLNTIDKNAHTYEGITHINSKGAEIHAPIDITITDLNQDTTQYYGDSIDVNGHEYEESAIQIFDNPLTHSEELRRIAINGSETLYGITYTPMNIDSIGHPWLEANDYVKLTNLEDSDLFFYPFDRKISYKGYITGTLSATYENNVSRNYENNNNILYRLTHTEINVDKANQRIESIIQEVNDTSEKVVTVTQDIDGITTEIENINNTVEDNTQEIASIKETVEGLSIEKSITGGNNLIKNSVGYFGNDFWMINNDTEGTVKTLNDIDVKNNSVSASALSLQNETIYQKITEIKNGSYYISFRYKKLLNNATCKLIINGEEFTLTSNSWKDEGKEIAVTSNNIQISLVSNMNDSCLITDLMLSNGTAKVSWTQNANETYTDSVKIGKGITITATGSDTELSATASSIDIVNTKNRENTSTFDKYGIKTNSLESRGTIKIANKLIISKVGDQMWISTL